MHLQKGKSCVHASVVHTLIFKRVRMLEFTSFAMDFYVDIHIGFFMERHLELASLPFLLHNLILHLRIMDKILPLVNRVLELGQT
ncbi:unnamed protein product [Linum trigynum]|uniref:Uncharacterized protein n=1 Tax=Linum trigynum TaxID=586398 RepID=A0AAV2EUS9_9ROSI